MAPAPPDQLYRGSGIDRPTVPLPPDYLSLFRAGQLRKRWHYVSFWSRELSFCAARVSVGPLRQEYWAIWDRAAQEFRERSHLFKRYVLIEPNRLQVNDSDVPIDVTYQSCSSFDGTMTTPQRRLLDRALRAFCVNR